MDHCTILQDQTFTLEVMFQFSKLMKKIDRRFHIYIGSKKLHVSYLEKKPNHLLNKSYYSTFCVRKHCGKRSDSVVVSDI